MTVARAAGSSQPEVQGASITVEFQQEVAASRTEVLRWGYSALQWGVQVDQFSVMDSLNFLGSNFGLWPGLGICQLVEWGLLRLPGLTHLAS